MKLHYLCNYSTEVEGYYIENASSTFKKKYPKKHICCSIENNKVWNVDDLKELPISPYKVSYFFTYDKTFFQKSDHSIWTWVPERIKHIDEWQRVVPADLNNYLIDDTDNSNIVMKIVPKSSSRDPRFINSIVIKTNNEFIKTVELKKSLESIIKSVYNENYIKSIDTTEKWLLNVLEEIPFDLNRMPFHFGNTIEDFEFKNNFSPTLNDFVIGYSTRIAKIEDEFEFIKLIETELSDFKSTDIVIFDDYTDIVERVAKMAKEKGIEYEQTDVSIRLASSDFYKLNLDFEIINFISC